MSKPTSTQRAYWMKTLWGWAEDRLSDPQFVECDSVLNYHIDAAAELATVKAQRDALLAVLEELWEDVSQGAIPNYDDPIRNKIVATIVIVKGADE